MDEALDYLTQLLASAVLFVASYYGRKALVAAQAFMKARASAQAIVLIEKAISSGVRKAKEAGLEEHMQGWLSSVLSYTKQSIPETLEREKIDDDQLANKIEAMRGVFKQITQPTPGVFGPYSTRPK